MATYYVDPSYGSNGAGTIGDPKNTWSGLTLTANNTYLQKRGTTYTGASVRPASQSSSAATPLTIGAYFYADGSDEPLLPKPIIDHNGGTNGVGAVFVDTCTNVLVENIDGRNSNGALGGGVTVRRSVGVMVRNCIGRDSEHGFNVQQDQASGTSVCTDVTFENCTAYNNVSLGFCLRWGAASTAILKRIAFLGCYAWGNGTGKGFGSGGTSVPCGGIGSYTQNKGSIGTAGFISYDIRCDHNTLRDNNGYGINIEGFANESWGGSISNNEITGSGASGDVDSHSLWAGNCSGLLIERNYVHHNSANIGASTGSGVGIFLDYNSSSTSGGANCIVRRNIVHDQHRGSTTAPSLAASCGIIVLANANSTVEANLVYNCRNGISVGNGQTTDGTLVYGNTFCGIDDGCISVLPSGTNTVVKNNVVRAAALGLFVNTTSTAGYSESFNSVSQCDTPKANGTATARTSTSLDASDITSDPLLSTTYRPKAGSPLPQAGTHLGYRRDLDKKQRQNPPCIGAYDAATMISG